MKFGIQLHSDRGADTVLREARLADEQGFDSVWLFDHLLGFRGTPVPHEPLDSFTLMTAVGAVPSRVRLAWAMLNPSFRNPAVLAKMLEARVRGAMVVGTMADQLHRRFDSMAMPRAHLP
jgi:alkanesulfonate monooxygenase SsuD/methylene tetrahydromethanopterin reductase-like flavin-dependent oxidoreductase (luciferase family)